MTHDIGDVVEHEDYGRGRITDIVTDNWGRTFAYYVQFEEDSSPRYMNTVNTPENMERSD